MNKDPGLELQNDVSTSNPYNQGFVTEAPIHLTDPPQRPRLSRTRAFFRRAFYGDTQPGTSRGRQTAFKRGLLFAFVIGLAIAGFIAVGLVLKGISIVTFGLPLAAVVIGCVILAGAAMCGYYCLCGRRTRQTTYTSTYTSTDGQHYDFSAHSQSYSGSPNTLPGSEALFEDTYEGPPGVSSQYGAAAPPLSTPYGRPVSSFPLRTPVSRAQTPNAPPQDQAPAQWQQEVNDFAAEGTEQPSFF